MRQTQHPTFHQNLKIWITQVLSLTFVMTLAVTSITSLAYGQDAPAKNNAGIQRATQATIGILKNVSQPAMATKQVTKANFTVRASGVHLRDGYILTAQHGVKGGSTERPRIAEKIQVLTGTLEEFPASLIGVNAFLDIAVYRIDFEEGEVNPLPNTTFGEKVAEPGDHVFTVGYPLGWGPAVAYGRVGNPNTFLPTMESRLYQVDLSTCSGNSGGGLFNEQGELVGIVHAIIQTGTVLEERRCSRFAFAVPGPIVQRMANALIDKKTIGFSRLGAQLTAIKVGNRWQVAISGVTQPAREAGILKGDILLAIEDTPITSAAQLKSFLTEHTNPGQKVTVTVLRGNDEHQLTVTLGSS